MKRYLIYFLFTLSATISKEERANLDLDLNTNSNSSNPLVKKVGLTQNK